MPGVSNFIKSIGVVITVSLISIGCSSYPLSKAAYNGDLWQVQTLVEGGSDVNQYDRWGWTPLMWAVYYGNYSITKYLLEKGANPNLATTGEYGSISRKSTPLMIAAYYGNVRYVKLLIEYNADVNVGDESGKTAMWFAEEYGFDKVLALLQEKQQD